MINISASKPKPLSTDDNMIPLINIVFLMLIFFMVAGHIEATSNVDIEPPESLSNIAEGEESVVLIVDVGGQVYLNEQPLARESMESELQDLLVNSSDINNLHLIVQVDASYPAASLKNLLADVKASGFRRVSLATTLVHGR